MSRMAKVVYFFVAVSIIICLAFASILMAQEKPGLAGLLFAIGMVIAIIGFVVKAKLRRREAADRQSL